MNFAIYKSAFVMEQYPKAYLYRRIVNAKLYIDTHFAESIELDHIADEANFSKFHFIRLFKDIYGDTPHQYLIQVRIEQAKQLLCKNVPIGEVCFSVGFNSVSSFTGLFKKCTGIIPSAFQMQQRQRKVEIEKHPLKFIPNCFAENNGWTNIRNFEEALQE